MLTFDQYINNLEKINDERMNSLKENIAGGVPQDEYRQMVGRYKERKAMSGEFRLIFNEMAKREEGDMDDDV